MQQKLFIQRGLITTDPFFYVIFHKLTAKYYAGYCSSRIHCNSATFMTSNEKTYRTSSNIVKELILETGIESFVIIRIRHFKRKEDALLYENRFLKKVDAMHNENFLNRTNGGKTFGCLKHSPETKIKIANSNRGGKRSSDTKRKMSIISKARWTNEEYRIKIIARLSGRRVSEETREKLRNRVYTEEHRASMSNGQQRRRSVEDLSARKSERLKASLCNIGKKWWNDGTVNKFSFERPGENWKPGMIFKKRKNKERGLLKWWNNGSKEIQVGHPTALSCEWKRGRLV